MVFQITVKLIQVFLILNSVFQMILTLVGPNNETLAVIKMHSEDFVVS